MAKAKKLTRLRPTFFQVVLLLVQYILVKIGQLPLWLIRSLVFLPFRDLQYSVKNIQHIFISIERLLTLPAIPHRQRGRPRKTIFIFPVKVPRRLKVATALSVLLILIYAYTSFIITAAYQLPHPDRLVSTTQPLTTEFYDREGRLLYRLYEGRNRTLITLDELPQYLIQATIAIEDKNFYKHSGIDVEAVGRALYHNFLNRQDGNLQGASTITQQLVKNSLLTPEKTYTRKLKEVILAFWAERIYSKNDILKMYFNEAPYGGPAWGIEAAAQTYFGKGARNLTLSESAFLAGLPASPTEYSPYGISPDLAKQRQVWVLARMVEEGYITEGEKMAAQSSPLVLKEPTNNILAPHFVFYTKNLLAQKFGDRVVSQGGLKIYTTLNLDLQQKIEEIVKNEVDNLSSLGVKNGAAMVTDAQSGQILAMVGSRNYAYPGFGNFNVTLSLRQPGSSIKVITYASAFKKGFSPGNTILDTPASFKDGARTYSPQNYDGTFHGPVSIRTALGSSYNVPAVRTLATVGIEDMIKTARDLGITTFEDPKRFGLSLTLGGGEVKMMEMMGVYGALSQMGRLNKPTPILKVTDSLGNLLEEYQDTGTKVLDPVIAYLITDILQDNRARTPAFGPSSLLSIPSYQVAVKTGTSDNKRDNWTFGYTPNFVVGAWVGNNDNTPMNPTLTSGVTGAAPIWRKITDLMLTHYPSAAFVRPSGIVEVNVDGRRDLAVAGTIPKGLVRVKKDGDKVIFSDAFSSFATPSASRPAEQAKIGDETTN